MKEGFWYLLFLIVSVLLWVAILLGAIISD